MSPSAAPDRRLLLVHAHPDDEAIGQGVTMAKYAAEGAHVTLVTCTLGEEGEVLVPGLEHLAADQDDALGEHRVTELAKAMAELGVSDHRFLGGPGRYRDSGMMGVESNNRPDCFWRADLLEAADLLVTIIRDIRPQVLVTYDQDGGYGHPDHIQAHRVAMYGALLAAVPSYRLDLGESWEIAKIYWSATKESRMRDGLRRMRDAGTPFFDIDPDGEMPSFVTPDELVTTEIDGRDRVEQKLAAMRAHATQIAVDGPFFALSNNVGNEAWGIESFRLAKGELGHRGEGVEDDLFAGVA
jgi:N-acetyl-1-D-myo-inositol-2-amino-2-deoxy-alpha-D-glucopyranoside deacetylase